MDGKYLRPFEQAIAETNGERIEALVGLVTDGVQSAHTRRAYARAIRDFLAWYRETGQVGLTKATVLRYVTHLRAGGMGASSINQRLSAIRKLAQECADNGVLSDSLAQGIRRAKGIRQEGVRQGFWLTREQAQALLNAPDTDTLKGLRDRAMLAVMLGCGLRRSEAASLTFAHVQQREGRWLICDLVGKRGKMRSVPMPAWAKEALERGDLHSELALPSFSAATAVRRNVRPAPSSISEKSVVPPPTSTTSTESPARRWSRQSFVTGSYS